MASDAWTAVDRYFEDRLIGDDPALEAALEASARAGLPEIAVSPSQGKLLYLLASSVGALSCRSDLELLYLQVTFVWRDTTGVIYVF